MMSGIVLADHADIYDNANARSPEVMGLRGRAKERV
jgi:hypothetical protein